MERQANPKYLKRQTMPAPIIASPLSPNSTGISIEADSPLSITGTPNAKEAEFSSPMSSPTEMRSNEFNRRQTMEITPPSGDISTSFPRWSSDPHRSPFRPSPEDHFTHAAGGIHLSAIHLPPSGTSSTTLPSVTTTLNPASSTSVMFPPTYRSSSMANRKIESFDSLSAGSSRRKLGTHLPRIASGDTSGASTENQVEQPSFHSTQRTRLRDHQFAMAIQEKRLTPSGVLADNGVAGLPGRISLKAPSHSSSLTPASRLLGVSWADKQRHLLQAYEYLCHVGEAQQWIEGCLGEELECGVVELEDTLQTGVTLARLVRVFQGEGAVKRIFEVRISCKRP